MSDNPTAPWPPPREPASHGEAALLVVESLIHTLVDNRVLPLGEAVMVVQVARDAQIDLVDAGRSGDATTELLESVLHSMEIDLGTRARGQG